MKEKIKKRFTDLDITRKMLLVYISFASLFLLIAVGMLQISFYTYSSELYDKSVQELDYFSQNVNRGLKEAETKNYGICMDRFVQQNLDELVNTDYPSIEYNQKLQYIRTILTDEYDPQSPISCMLYIDQYGNKLEIGTSPWEISDKSVVEIQNKMIEAGGAYATYGPTYDCPFFVSGRVIKNRLDMSLSDLGMLICVCDVNEIIEQNKNQLSSDEAAVYVYNKDCAVYEDTGTRKIAGLPTYKKHSGYHILSEKGKKFFVSYLYSEQTDWTYVSFFPYSDIYGQVQTMRSLLFVGFIAVFAILVFCMKKIAGVITSPLEHLIDSMHIVENGDFEAAGKMLVITDRKDEIGALNREFKSMIETVDNLIKENYEKQLLIKDTKYKMLRAQINPHFLYNTLNVVHWMIRAGRNDEAGKMIVELGAILHYAFARKPYATIKDEIDMVRSYITIQSMRYQDRIDFSVETEGELERYTIPRMIIQPLVENAINYGAEPYMDRCRIAVRVIVEDDDILMTVEDTGAGMNIDELEAVRKFDFVPKGHGIGLKNIAERLKMDDERSRFDIDSELGKGTKITIRMNKRTGDEDNV